MDGCDPSGPVDQKRARQRVQATVQLAEHLRSQQDAVVHLAFLNVRLDDAPAILVHGNANHRKTLVLVGLLELDEPGDFDLTGAAPGGPKIEQDNLALIVGKLDASAIGVLQGEIRRRFAVFLRLHGRMHHRRSIRTRAGDDRRSQ